MGIIEDLDSVGINLQETILNLKNQGYTEVYNAWINKIWNKTINLLILEKILKTFGDSE